VTPDEIRQMADATIYEGENESAVMLHRVIRALAEVCERLDQMIPPRMVNVFDEFVKQDAAAVAMRSKGES